MDKVKLKVGDVFTLTKSSSLYYRILELDKSSNYAKIELICPYDIDNWNENWTLSSIEEGFKEGNYKLVKQYDNIFNIYRRTYNYNINQQNSSLCTYQS